MIESNEQDWGLCDHYLVAQEFDDDAEEDYGDEWDDSDEDDAGRRYATTLTGEWLPVPNAGPGPG
jgi:hypothetical protein